MVSIYEKLVESIREGAKVSLCTVIDTSGGVPRHAGAKMLVYENREITGTVGGGQVEAQVIATALEAIQNNRPRLINFSLDSNSQNSMGSCGGKMTVYIEPQGFLPKLLVLGAGHVGKAVARLGEQVGFQVFLSDDRADLLNESDFPGTISLLPVAIIEVPNNFFIDKDTYIVMVTRGSDVDLQILPTLLQNECAYIGLIGSKRRWESTRQGLIERGFSEESILKIKTPIGLDIHAETPDEIAVSILAEIIQRKNLDL